jgi:citrate lyase subunit beta/citryl-CoA lyase
VAIAARAAGVQALDTPYVGFQDPKGLESESQLAKEIGFTGKCAIHPSQIETIRKIFVPSEAELEKAHRIIGAWDEAERRGSGATSLDGNLVDTPVVERARRLLANSR